MVGSTETAQKGIAKGNSLQSNELLTILALYILIVNRSTD